MTENIIPVITEAGKIWGRDAIFLDKVNVINESTFELIGDVNAKLCSNLQDSEDRNYCLTFKGVLLFKMTELDYSEVQSNSSFDQIENSLEISKMMRVDKANHIGKINLSHKHFVFSTYDTVFEVICSDFDFKLLG